MRTFYEKVVEKLVKKFPFEEPLLNCARFLEPAVRTELSAADIITLMKRFPQVFSPV